MNGIRIGELLVEQGILSDEQVKHILQVQKAVKRPFGDLAERLYGVNPSAIEDAWVQQYVRLSGVVDLQDQEVDADCLRALNRRQAWQFHMLPLFRDEMDLHIATTSDNLVRAVNFATRTLAEPVYLRIASRQQLQDFLMKYYPVPGYIADYAEHL